MPQFARCANPACGIVLNLRRFPEGSPCHKCGEKRRLPLQETQSETAPRRSRSVRLLGTFAVLVAVVAASGAGFLLARPEHAPAPPTILSPSPEPQPANAAKENTPAESSPARQSAPPSQPSFLDPVPKPESARPPREYTTFRKAIGEDTFMREYDPNKPSDIQQYDGARLRLDLASYALYLETDAPHTKYPGPVFHWLGRSEILLPACDALEIPLLCDVVGRRVYEIPEDALLEEDEAFAVDRAARTPLPRAGVRLQATVDVGFYHMIFVIIDTGEGGPPLLAGFGYTGQRLPIRPPAP